MIGKITKGKEFAGLLQYVFSKATAEYIGGNMIGKTTEELRMEFRRIANRNERVQNPVAHISLSPSPKERISDATMLELVSEYMDRLGFGECQWVVAKHSDTQTPEGLPRVHYHIIANRVKISDNKVVSSWMDWKRTEKILRELEQEFGLMQVPCSWEVERSAPSTGQERRKRREKQQYEQGLRHSPPDEPVKVQIQQAVDQAALNNLTMPQLMVRLQEEWGVTARIGLTRTGKIKGISYSKDGVSLSGTQLGKAYTFPGLQKYRGISYSPERDDETIRTFNTHRSLYSSSSTEKKPTDTTVPTGVESGTATPEEHKSQLKHYQTHFVANTLAKYLNSLSTNYLEGKKYIGKWENEQLTLHEKVESQNPTEILRVEYERTQHYWIGIVSQLREQHIRDFEEIDKELLKREKNSYDKHYTNKKES
ncbi:MAG TPA: hypothetical protein DCP31_18660, partial [Cyanobacteria bacterium UBA8543]|nr:hypothetical protein [Cyanobacteria bacterium UBA8543]